MNLPLVAAADCARQAPDCASMRAYIDYAGGHMTAQDNPLLGWQVDRSLIRTVGHDLQRPECILAEPDGTLWSADARGGVMRIDADGSQSLIAQSVDTRFADSDSPERYMLKGTLPNGLAFDLDGNILIANFGTDHIELMTRDGQSRTLYTQLDGQPLGKTNFILRDRRNRIWFTVTTRSVPWTRSINEKLPDGYVGMIDERGIRIMADGFVGTNEIRFDATEEWLYVVETNARRISRLRVHADGTLSDREIYGPSDLGGIPDGCAFDAHGNLWTTLVHYDRLIALTPQGELLTLLDDGDPEKVAVFETHFFGGTMSPAVMGATAGTIAPLMASVTFGGADLRTVYLGSLRGTTIPYFRSPVAGLPMVHWR
jgi:gluconolactonase